MRATENWSPPKLDERGRASAWHGGSCRWTATNKVVRHLKKRANVREQVRWVGRDPGWWDRLDMLGCHKSWWSVQMVKSKPTKLPFLPRARSRMRRWQKLSGPPPVTGQSNESSTCWMLENVLSKVVFGKGGSTTSRP